MSTEPRGPKMADPNQTARLKEIRARAKAKKPPLPVTLRNQDISEGDVAKLAKAAEEGTPPAPTRKVPEGRRPKHERLPHGSRFDEVVWDAEKGLWTGCLRTTDRGMDRPFVAVGRTVFGLMSTLDVRYRHWLKEQAARSAEDRLLGVTETGGPKYLRPSRV